MKPETQQAITIRATILGVFFSGLFAALTVYLENFRAMCPTANQIPLFPYVLLLLVVMLLNPLLRLLRCVRPLATAELMLVFVMCTVSAGISTFGLTSHLLPVAGSLFNRHWNTHQSQWNLYVEPFVNEQFFVAEPGIREQARRYAEAYAELTRRRQALQAAGKAGLPEAQDGLLQSCREQETLMQAEQKKLRELEELAFAKVDLFRRGLPAGQRAIPGVLPTAADTAGSYLRRLQRLRLGLKAGRELRAAQALLHTDGYFGGGESWPPEFAAHLQRAAALLQSADQGEVLQEHAGSLRTLQSSLFAAVSASQERTRELSDLPPNVPLGQRREISAELSALNRKVLSLQKDLQANSVLQDICSREIELSRLVSAARAEVLALLACRPLPAAAAADQTLGGILAQFSRFDASLRRYFMGEVPWGHWVRPLFNWGLLIVCSYLVLMSFNVLIFRQWHNHEKLIFPLAELPELIADTGSQPGRVFPLLMSNSLFWVGVLLSAGVMGWNLLCNSESVPGLTALDLVKSWNPFVANGMFKGLVGAGRSSIFFTLIGLSFLIPKKVSFSLWFFQVLYFILLLLLVAFGFGQNASSFPSEWWFTQSFRYALGSGALLVFSSLVLWKCRQMLFCAFRPLPEGVTDPAERQELRLSSAVFWGSSAALVLLLWLHFKVNFYYALFGFAVIMVISIGLIRSVAEGGVPGFQAHCSPFHFIRNIFGMDKSFTAPHLYAPLILYYAILYLDIKALIAPAMANGLKIREDFRMPRLRYHLCIWLAILAAAAVAIAVALIFAYHSGADTMSGWFYTTFPKTNFDKITSVARVPLERNPGITLWLLAGMLVMGALLYFRQTQFWLPHPIGMIMLINPLMFGYWFSMLLGWIAKALVTRYGNKDTYLKTRGFFLGLIVGELLIVALAGVLSLVLQKNLGIDLNR
ncbi:MAG: hypothetical protein GX564_12430 [Oligosphaeraceae bacterium]|nr:hypothetical protein [Oligosphaeraceae bacterium]